MADLAPVLESAPMATGVAQWMSKLNDEPTPPKPKAIDEPPAPTPPAEPDVPLGTPEPEPVPAPDPAPPKPPVPDKPAAPPEPPQPVPKNRKEWDNAKEAIKKPLLEEIGQWKGKFEASQAEITKLKETSAKAPSEADKTEIERLKKENQEYSERIQLLDVTQHPKFQAHFDNRVNAQYDLAKRIVGPEQSEAIVAALKLPNTPEFAELKIQKLNEALEQLTPIQQSRIGSVLNELEQIEAGKQSEIQRLSAKREEIKKQEQAEVGIRRQKQEQLFDTVVKSFQDPKTGFDTYKMIEGNDDWNKGVADRISQAKDVIFGNKITPEGFITAALHLQALPMIVAEATKVHARNKELEAQVARLSKAGATLPPAGGANGGAPTPPPSGVKVGMPPRQAVESYVNSVIKAGAGG